MPGLIDRSPQDPQVQQEQMQREAAFRAFSALPTAALTMLMNTLNMGVGRHGVSTAGARQPGHPLSGMMQNIDRANNLHQQGRSIEDSIGLGNTEQQAGMAEQEAMRRRGLMDFR